MATNARPGASDDDNDERDREGTVDSAGRHGGVARRCITPIRHTSPVAARSRAGERSAGTSTSTRLLTGPVDRSIVKKKN